MSLTSYTSLESGQLCYIYMCQYDVPISIFSFTCVTHKQENVSGSHPIHVKFTYLDDEIFSPTMFEFVVSCFSLSRYILPLTTNLIICVNNELYDPTQSQHISIFWGPI